MEERVETPGHTIIAVTVLLFQSLRQITWRTLSCCKGKQTFIDVYEFVLSLCWEGIGVRTLTLS